MKTFLSFLFLTPLFLFTSCRSGENKKVPEEQYLPGAEAVALEIHPLETGKGSEKWLVSYIGGGKLARFVVELGSTEDQKSGDFTLAYGEGRFLSQPNSDPSALLSELAKIHGIPNLMNAKQRVKELRFEYVVLGKQQSQVQGGGFSSEPAGNWKAMKLFIGGADDEAQIFFNLNPKINKGEFSIKDEEYGKQLLEHLSKVL